MMTSRDASRAEDGLRIVMRAALYMGSSRIAFRLDLRI